MKTHPRIPECMLTLMAPGISGVSVRIWPMVSQTREISNQFWGSRGRDWEGRSSRWNQYASLLKHSEFTLNGMSFGRGRNHKSWWTVGSQSSRIVQILQYGQLCDLDAEQGSTEQTSWFNLKGFHFWVFNFKMKAKGDENPIQDKLKSVRHDAELPPDGSYDRFNPGDTG